MPHEESGPPTPERSKSSVAPDRESDGTTRRVFLGAVGGGVVTLSVGGEAVAARPRPTTTIQDQPAPEPITVQCTLNGQPQEFDADPREVLAETLHEKLSLTGTKIGCNHGACGACTVHIDGRRVLSCLTLTATVTGTDITTIEGVGDEANLHPLQQEFLACDGYQCGYCTPGQIMSGIACIHEGHAGGDDEEIREWMSGNLCRCGAYPNIVDAVRNANTTVANASGGAK